MNASHVPGAAGAPGEIIGARLGVEHAIAGRIFPAAGLEVGSSAGALWSDALGTLTFDAGSSPARLDTPFDLASLTKVLVTTTVLMELVRKGRVRLDDPVSDFFNEWRGADRAHVTVRDLLEHASGLPARLVDAPPGSRHEFEHEICRIKLEYEPRAQSIYSDLGFILLGFLAADRGGAPLPELFDRIAAQTYVGSGNVGSGNVGSGFSRIDDGLFSSLTFDLPPESKKLAAPTLPLAEDLRRGRSLSGEVHDNYAAALGGAAGHAGLFGDAPAVGAFARLILRAARGDRDLPAPFFPELVAEFTTKSTVPGSSRALGWDTMLPTSSCGTGMSPKAFGHVGFTGTSVWVDPVRDRYFVLLTNRACGGGSLDDMRTVRRAFHDALADL
ncbi:MAG TPA: serine hydrolase domain-containing protein [Vicinamibacterales bacterium]